MDVAATIGSWAPRSRGPVAPENVELKRLVDLVRSGRTPEVLSRGFEPTAQSIRQPVLRNLTVHQTGRLQWCDSHRLCVAMKPATCTISGHQTRDCNDLSEQRGGRSGG